MTTVLLMGLSGFFFFLQQKSSTPKNLLRSLFDNMGSTSVPLGTLSLTFGGFKLRYLFLIFVFWTMTTKLQDSFCSLFDVNLLYQVQRVPHQYFQRSYWISICAYNLSTPWRHHVANLHNTKTSISPKRKKIIQKRKAIELYIEKPFK